MVNAHGEGDELANDLLTFGGGTVQIQGGINVGDLLTMVDGVDVRNMDLAKVTALVLLVLPQHAQGTCVGWGGVR